jgi:UDP-N-acetylmuramate-alanine ligase
VTYNIISINNGCKQYNKELNYSSNYLLNEPENTLKMLRVTFDIIHKDGYAILNADDPNIKDLEKICDGKIIYYTTNSIETNEVLVNHSNDEKNRIVMLKDDYVCLYENKITTKLFQISNNNVKISCIKRNFLLLVD